MIELRDLAKRFGSVQALAGASFTARDGAITGLLGPNGAGKSTALRILCTVLRPDAGTAAVDGIDATRDPIGVRARIGVLPHNANLYANLSTRENIAYYAALQGLESDAGAAAVDRVLDTMQIADIADRRTKGFSQGQRIRVGLARALVHDPRTLILDEPTNGLDVMATRALRDVIRERRDAGCCVLLASHVMQEVAALCDRIVILSHGKVVAAGTPDEIRAATGQDDLEDAFVEAIGGAEEDPLHSTSPNQAPAR